MTRPAPLTIADYWVEQGFTRREAIDIEREQIAADVAAADEASMYDAGAWNAY